MHEKSTEPIERLVESQVRKAVMDMTVGNCKNDVMSEKSEGQSLVVDNESRQALRFISPATS